MPAQETYQITEHQWIVMDDGVRLSARLWIPDTTSNRPAPVVLEYIPYRKRDGYRFHDNAWGDVLASHGIAFARIDVRGSGDSEGVLTDEYTQIELEDGVRCIDWLSRQPWCNGNVGMRGISWGAINTLQIAALQPRALKAILSIAGTDHRYTDDAHYLGGTLAQANLQWGLSFKSVMAGPPDPQIVGAGWLKLWRDRLRSTPAIITRWLDHQYFDDYWQRGSIALDYASIRCPTYVVAGWQDTYANPVGRLLEQLTVPRRGLIGPWAHTYPEMAVPGGVDWASEEVRWWRHWLCGEETGIMAGPMLRAYMPYCTAREVLPRPVPGRWIAEARWPPAAASTGRYFLSAQGLSALAPGRASPITHRPAAPVGSTHPEWLDLLPGEQSTDDAHSLCFDSPVLDSATEILGYPVLRLHLSVDQARASIAVRLNEVDSAGQSWPVSFGLRKLSARNSHRAPDTVVPGEFYSLSLPLQFCAHRFKRGNRIRVAISNGLWPMTWPTAAGAALTVAIGQSVIELPVREVEATAQPLPFAAGVGAAKHAPEAFEPVTVNADGSWLYRKTRPLRSFVEPEVGTHLSSELTETVRLEADGSAISRQRLDRSWRRDDWDCRLEIGCEVRASSGAFQIRESLKACLGDRLLFARESDTTVDRLQ
ncbi:MAG: CocE/NonD family hydrolase [Pseudomonadales bacterium]|nr:CocE/NonD family hydrolase [Pseudomonadales bacterium]